MRTISRYVSNKDSELLISLSLGLENQIYKNASNLAGIGAAVLFERLTKLFITKESTHGIF